MSSLPKARLLLLAFRSTLRHADAPLGDVRVPELLPDVNRAKLQLDLQTMFDGETSSLLPPNTPLGILASSGGRRSPCGLSWSWRSDEAVGKPCTARQAVHVIEWVPGPRQL